MSPENSTDFAYLCAALEKADSPAVLSVLDPATGEFLEHRQLRQDPHYTATWDTSYANELGQLCQGVGIGNTPSGQQVAGIDAFFLTNPSPQAQRDLPYHGCL
jgi:hypothetical protein